MLAIASFPSRVKFQSATIATQKIYWQDSEYMRHNTAWASLPCGAGKIAPSLNGRAGQELSPT